MHLKGKGHSWGKCSVYALGREDIRVERFVKEAMYVQLEELSLNRGGSQHRHQQQQLMWSWGLFWIGIILIHTTALKRSLRVTMCKWVSPYQNNSIVDWLIEWVRTPCRMFPNMIKYLGLPKANFTSEKPFENVDVFKQSKTKAGHPQR